MGIRADVGVRWVIVVWARPSHAMSLFTERLEDRHALAEITGVDDSFIHSDQAFHYVGTQTERGALVGGGGGGGGGG